MYALATKTVYNKKLPKGLTKKLGKQLIHVWMQLSFQTEGIRICKPGLLIRIAFDPDTDRIWFPNLYKSG
jgi:hypothetical protein